MDDVDEGALVSDGLVGRDLDEFDGEGSRGRGVHGGWMSCASLTKGLSSGNVATTLKASGTY